MVKSSKGEWIGSRQNPQPREMYNERQGYNKAFSYYVREASVESMPDRMRRKTQKWRERLPRAPSSLANEMK